MQKIKIKTRQIFTTFLINGIACIIVYYSISFWVYVLPALRLCFLNIYFYDFYTLVQHISLPISIKSDLMTCIYFSYLSHIFGGHVPISAQIYLIQLSMFQPEYMSFSLYGYKVHMVKWQLVNSPKLIKTPLFKRVIKSFPFSGFLVSFDLW